MATKNLYSTLLGYDPYERELQKQKLWAGLYGSASSPYEKIGLGIAQLGGIAADKLFGDETTNPVGQLNKLTSEAAAQFTPNSAEYFKYIADNSQDQNVKRLATEEMLKAEAANTKALREDVKFYGDNPSVATDKLQELQGKIETYAMKLGYDPTRPETLTPQIQAALNARPEMKQFNAISNAYQQGFYKQQKEMQEAPGTAADRAVYDDMVRKNGGDIVAAAKEFNQYKTNLKQKENTPLTAGDVKAGDINTFIGSVETNLKPYRTKLTAYNEIRALLQQAASGNTAAVPQLERFLTTLAGDKQLSATEMKLINNSGGFVETTVGGVQKFVVGTLTADKINKTIKLLNSLENQTSKEYNTMRDKLESTWATSNLPKQTLEAQLGGRYIPASQRDKFPSAKPKKMVTKTTASGIKYTVLEDEQ